MRKKAHIVGHNNKIARTSDDKIFIEADSNGALIYKTNTNDFHRITEIEATFDTNIMPPAILTIIDTANNESKQLIKSGQPKAGIFIYK